MFTNSLQYKSSSNFFNNKDIYKNIDNFISILFQSIKKNHYTYSNRNQMIKFSKNTPPPPPPKKKSKHENKQKHQQQEGLMFIIYIFIRT